MLSSKFVLHQCNRILFLMSQQPGRLKMVDTYSHFPLISLLWWSSLRLNCHLALIHTCWVWAVTRSLFITASLLWGFILMAMALSSQPARIDQQISCCRPALKEIKDFALVCKNGSTRLMLVIAALLLLPPTCFLLFLSWAKMYWVGCGVIKFQLATFV